MPETDNILFDLFVQPLIGQPVSHLWSGYGSAIFLELGALTHTSERRRSGTLKPPQGELSVMIEWDWRIQGRKTIICGSSSDARDKSRGYSLIRNKNLVSISLVENTHELDLGFSNGVRFLSFMTDRGNPQWAVFNRRGSEVRTLHARNRQIQIESGKG